MSRFICNACPRNCGALREDCVGYGACKSGALPKVARIAPHYDEEPIISGIRGSGTVFFSGCALRCVYCQNAPISHGDVGFTLPDDAFRSAIDALIARGVHNVNFVNPTHFAHCIPNDLPIPIVYNSSGYESVDTLKSLEGRVNLYLPDLKYIDADGAKRYSGAEDYPKVVKRAIDEMARQVGGVKLNDEGVATKGLIVRHLVLPGRVIQTKLVLSYMKDHLPDGALVSLMAQYTPFGQGHDLTRGITRNEYDSAVNHMAKLGISGFIQELSSGDDKYVPAFDGQGVKEFL